MILDLPPELIQIIIDTFKGFYNQAFFKTIVMFIFTLLLNIIDMIETLVVSDFDMLIFELENWLKNRIQLVCAIAIKHDNIIIARWALFHGAEWTMQFSNFLAIDGNLRIMKKLSIFIPANHFPAIIYLAATYNKFDIVRYGINNQLVGDSVNLINLFAIVVSKEDILTLKLMVNTNTTLINFVRFYAEHNNCRKVLFWLNSC